MEHTCFRCGGGFEGKRGQRVCPVCRRPRPSNHRAKTITTRTLTLRERQIAALVAEGKLNKEIAWLLKLTEGTVKEYLNRIFRKMQLRNRTELAAAWIRGAYNATVKEQPV